MEAKKLTDIEIPFLLNAGKCFSCLPQAHGEPDHEMSN